MWAVSGETLPPCGQYARVQGLEDATAACAVCGHPQADHAVAGERVISSLDARAQREAMIVLTNRINE